jgi:hypothetical protein
MKKHETLDLSEDKALAARRRSRRAIGAVKPSKVEEPATVKGPKHKKRQSEREMRGE